jgi:hypothetical protein
MGTLYIDGKLKGSLEEILEIVRDTESRLETCEHQLAKRTDQSGNNWAEKDGLTPYQSISGNADWGTDPGDAVKVLGSDDTPIDPDAESFVLAFGLVDDVSVGTSYLLRLIFAFGGSMDDAITAGQYVVKRVKFDASPPTITASAPFRFACPPFRKGTRIWAQCKNATDNATLDFFVSIQERDTVVLPLDI